MRKGADCRVQLCGMGGRASCRGASQEPWLHPHLHHPVPGHCLTHLFPCLWKSMSQSLLWHKHGGICRAKWGDLITYTLFPAAARLTEPILCPSLTSWPVSSKFVTREEASKVVNSLQAWLEMGCKQDGCLVRFMFVFSFWSCPQWDTASHRSYPKYSVGGQLWGEKERNFEGVCGNNREYWM